MPGVEASSDVEAIRCAATEDADSVLALARDLIRVPSRAGVDPYDDVLATMRNWLTAHGLHPEIVTGKDGSTVGLAVHVDGARPGPLYVLDACLDAAGFGDIAAWTHPPTSAHVADGWLWGRGSGDSKTGAAIFAHLAVRIAAERSRLAGRLGVLFEVDEHTGNFGAAHAYFGHGPGRHAAGVMIGYPGCDEIVIGGRGVLRLQLHIHGIASHSGSRRPGQSAIAKAAELVTALHAISLPEPTPGSFPLPGKLTVTSITGGEGFSTVPDLCTLNVDIRLTDVWDAATAEAAVRQAAADIDGGWPDTLTTTADIVTCWPPFHLTDTAPLARSLVDAARHVGFDARPVVAGPSNIGNYLAGLGIPATAGFGVECSGCTRRTSGSAPTRCPTCSAHTTWRSGSSSTLMADADQ